MQGSVCAPLKRNCPTRFSLSCIKTKNLYARSLEKWQILYYKSSKCKAKDNLSLRTQGQFKDKNKNVCWMRYFSISGCESAIRLYCVQMHPTLGVNDLPVLIIANFSHVYLEISMPKPKLITMPKHDIKVSSNY